MFLVGYNIFGLDAISKTTNYIANPYRVELTNQICDQVHLRRNASLLFNINKDVWQADSIFLADFKDNLEAGNINLSGLTITKIKVKKRKINTLKWSQIAELDFNIGQNLYSIIDKFVESYQDYEYAIVPVATTIEGQYNTVEVEAQFDGAFIFDKNTQYKLYYNFQLGDISIISPNSIIETLGSKYPIIAYSGNVHYQKGSIDCLLLTDGSLQANNGQIDIKQEKLLRKQITEFLTNKKPKVLKNADGLYCLINIIREPKVSPNNNITGMYNLSFEFVESGDVEDTSTLINTGLL